MVAVLIYVSLHQAAQCALVMMGICSRLIGDHVKVCIYMPDFLVHLML